MVCLRRIVLALLVPLLLPGCASLYFQDAEEPPEAPTRHQLSAWPWPEYWTGVIFNGEKIGFSRLALHRGSQPDRYEIDAEAVISLRFLSVSKSISLRSLDVVHEDLTLDRFHYDYVIDGTPMEISGQVEGSTLRTTVVTGGRPLEQAFSLEDNLYPMSAVNLVPVLTGLRVGADYRYTVYDGENQALAEVTQAVEGWETSELFTGSAYKLATRLHGFTTTTWLNQEGLPVFELALNGVMISALENEDAARRYLLAASVNKEEALLEFSRVKPDRPIGHPRSATRLEALVSGLPAGKGLPSGAGQECAPSPDGVRCVVRSVAPGHPGATGRDQEAPPNAKYLATSVTVQTAAPQIRNTARTIVGGETGNLARTRLLVDWIQSNVERDPSDVFSALDVLQTRKAECQGHAWLFAALARSLGIPTRVVSGLVYSAELDGFLYHSWNESLVDGVWLPVDPTFGQVGADATHLRMLEGDGLVDMLPLLDFIGKLKIRVLDVGYAPAQGQPQARATSRR